MERGVLGGNTPTLPQPGQVQLSWVQRLHPWLHRAFSLWVFYVSLEAPRAGVARAGNSHVPVGKAMPPPLAGAAAAAIKPAGHEMS